MKSEIKKLPNSEIEMEIEVSKEELDSFIKKAFLQLGENLNIEGFRKGKAPKNIIEEKIGRENILAEAAEMAVNENYRKAVLENNLEPIGQPNVEVLKLAEGNPFVFKAVFSVLPDIKIADYKKIAESKKREKTEVLENEIEDAVKWLLKSRTKFILKNGPAENGDFVNIEYRSDQLKGIDKKDSYEDSFVLKEGRFIPGFEENIIGMKAGESKKFSVDFPSDYFTKELSGKKVDFDLSLKSVQKAEIPELNDDFAKSLGNFNNLEALKNNIKEGIKFEKEQAQSQKIRQEIVSEVSKASEMEIPEMLIKSEQHSLAHNFRHEVEDRMKIKFEDYLDKIKKTEKELTDSFYEEAKKRVREFLVLREIGVKEKIEIKEEEVKEEADKFLKQYGNAEQAKKEIDIERLKNYAREAIRNEKIFQKLESFIK